MTRPRSARRRSGEIDVGADVGGRTRRSFEQLRGSDDGRRRVLVDTETAPQIGHDRERVGFVLDEAGPGGDQERDAVVHGVIIGEIAES